MTAGIVLFLMRGLLVLVWATNLRGRKVPLKYIVPLLAALAWSLVDNSPLANFVVFPLTCLVFIALCTIYKRPPDDEDKREGGKKDAGTELTDVQQHSFSREVQQAAAPA
jgi:hypothetical protein